MIDAQTKEKLLEELEKTPFIETASKKIGVHKSTVYRWMKKNEKFKEQIDESLAIGRAGFAEFAESKLMKKVEEEHFPAIKFVLENNDKRYIKPRSVYINRDVLDKEDPLTEAQKAKLDKILEGK